MTLALMSTFDQPVSPGTDPLLSAVSALTAHAADTPSIGELVIVVRPHTSRQRVVAGGGNGTLRAAVSAATSGHDRLWSSTTIGSTDEVAVRTLPEVLRAAAEAARISTAHIGRVETAGGLACVALWFETLAGVASIDERQTALAVLAAAAEKSDAADPLSQAKAAFSVAEIDPCHPVRREFDPADPELDPVTGVAHAERFAERLANFDNDEANLLIIDLDDFHTVDPDLADEALRTIADRLVGGTRSKDVVGRIGPNTFALLFGTIDRSDAFNVAKRLFKAIMEPIGDLSLTATIAVAHQDGLLDMDELREIADQAISSGKRAGGGRLVMAG